MKLHLKNFAWQMLVIYANGAEALEDCGEIANLNDDWRNFCCRQARDQETSREIF